MDIKAKVEEVVSKIKDNKALAESFKKDPIAAVKSIIGVDLPDDVMSKIVDGVKTKVSLDKIGDAADSIKDTLKKLF